MKINRALLTYGISKSFEDTIDFSLVQLDSSHIRKIDSCDVKVVATDYESILRLEVDIHSKVIGVCSYTLEDVELDINVKDEINFTDDENDEDCYYTNETLIDLDEYILGILLANVPVRIVKKGAKLTKDGNGYRVLKQDDYEKEKENSTDHRWDKLDNIDFSED